MSSARNAAVSLKEVSPAKRSIREAFLRLYTEKDLSKISIVEVAAASGYNRATFYHHYKTVYDILEELEDELVSMFRKLIFSIVDVEKTENGAKIPEERLAAFWQELQHLLNRPGERMFILLVKKRTSRLTANLKTMIRSFLNFLVPKNYRDMVEVDFLLSSLTAMELELFLKYFADPGKIEFEKIIKFAYLFADSKDFILERMLRK